ncbi:hypothetical protein CDD82_5080 [Ophiocordyceps australis]|uniref:asparagine synthase (glutamine-hydrolyzing) n=1 Tax=Ophiocordyceps australis TaxID=1399860 RepID=A0A2C5ZL62_9HYPO|nr:hypothetical protein CDD82_5080 [Ophiocordyceps australis]
MILHVRERLVQAVRLRLQADVPIGIYLSGGIDSSSVAGIVTHLSRTQGLPINNSQLVCFCVEFPAASGLDESDVAQRTAQWLGAKLVKIKVDQQVLADCFVDATWHSEMHHLDLNAVAKHALSKLPLEHGIKVVLLGEGSDEHFAGYAIFPVDYLREPDGALPQTRLAQDDPLRQRLFADAYTTLQCGLDAMGVHGKSLVDLGHAALALVNHCSMPAAMLNWHIALPTYQFWVLQRTTPGQEATAMVEAIPPHVRAKMLKSWHPLHTSMYIWQKNLFPNFLLAGMGDRAEMAHGIEGRHPFLDHHLTDYVNRLPPSVKLSLSPPGQFALAETNQGAPLPNKDMLHTNKESMLPKLTEKWILREAVRPFITTEIYHRKKQSFLAPMSWPADGPLHRLLQKILTRAAVDQLGFVDSDFVLALMPGAFGPSANSNKFRILVAIAAWVVLAQKMGIPTATVDDWLD